MTTQQYTLEQARDILGITRRQLADQSGISWHAIWYIETGKSVCSTNQTVALALAETLGLEVNEIDWPRGISHLGRPAKTGKPIQGIATRVISTCSIHNIALPASGECDDCI